MLHRIQKIISAKPYTIVCEWTNGEIRAIDMESKLRKWAAPAQSVYKDLLDKNIFISVNLDPEAETLFWDGLLNMNNTKDKKARAPLDLDREVLYEMSVPISE